MTKLVRAGRVTKQYTKRLRKTAIRKNKVIVIKSKSAGDLHLPLTDNTCDLHLPVTENTCDVHLPLIDFTSDLHSVF